MKTEKYIRIFIFSIICISLFFCKREEVTLHGDLTGIITDATTSDPIQGAGVKLSPVDDTTSTGSDGKYLFKNIRPGEYTIEASKFSYNTITKNVDVLSAKTKVIDFTLNGIPVPEISVAYLDFELDLTSLSFTISNNGKGKLTYVFTISQDWITVDPNHGDVTDETDDITVTIDKTGLSDSIYKETIQIISDVSKDTIDVYLNGLMDIDFNYYKVVTIGTQTWMAENLKTTKYNDGTVIPLVIDPTTWSNLTTSGYCWYNNDEVSYKNTYGALYNWYTVNTGKLCPTGWHVPTDSEWTTLTDYLGGEDVAGGKLKEVGTTHWNSPNTDATNESGFTALPGGYRGYSGGAFYSIGGYGYWWSSTEYSSTNAWSRLIRCSYGYVFRYYGRFKEYGFSVRCVRD